MELHNTSLQYAFPYQNMEFHITKILKEIIAQNCTPGRRSPLVRLFPLLQEPVPHLQQGGDHLGHLDLLVQTSIYIFISDIFVPGNMFLQH